MSKATSFAHPPLLECRKDILGPGGSQRHHPCFDLCLIFLPPATAADAFQQHQQAFCVVETCLYTIGKPHQRASAAAVARNIQLNGIGYRSQFQIPILMCAAAGWAMAEWWPLTACSLFRNVIVRQGSPKNIFR